MDPDALLAIVIVLIGGGSTGYLAYTVVQVIRRRMLGEGSSAGEELEELRYRMAELEEHGHVGSDHDLIARVAELEERLDFAERLLASEDNRAQLPEPTDEVSTESTPFGGHQRVDGG